MACSSRGTTRVPACSGLVPARAVVGRRAQPAALLCRRQRDGIRGSALLCRAGKIEKINGEQLEVAVQNRDKPLIIDFMATWCGPCVLMAQELEKVADELGDTVRIVKIDTDEEQEVSSQLAIQGLPTLVFIGTGDKPALRTEGLLPAETIKQIIREELMGEDKVVDI